MGKDELICQITKDILEEDINCFIDLVSYVEKKYGDNGIIVLSIKTNFFKELVEDNYRFWRERITAGI